MIFRWLMYDFFRFDNVFDYLIETTVIKMYTTYAIEYPN